MANSPDPAETPRRQIVSEAFFHRLVDAIPSMVWVSKSDGDARFINQTWMRLTGQSIEQACGFGWLEIVHPDDRPRLLDSIGPKLEARETFEIEVRYHLLHVGYRWHMVRAVRVPDSDSLDQWFGISVDIEQIHATEEMVEAQMRAIVSNAVDGIITIDAGGTIRFVNPAVERIFGYSEHEVLGQNISMLMPEPYRSEHDNYIANYLSSGKRKIIGIGREVEGRRKDGTTFPMDLAVSELNLVDRRMFTGMVRDISKRKESERLAAMGQMLSGIAHESRNALQRIQAGADMLSLEIDPQSELADDLATITRAREDLQTLFEELRGYAAPIHLDRTQTDLRHVWRQAWTHLEVDRGHREVALQELADDVDLVSQVDAFRMEQVFRNLFENSIAACDDPVQIQIEARKLSDHGQPTVAITYRDNGPGLSHDQQSRVFEAFFTTKSKGTGLGMAIARRIVEAHRGSIRCLSRSGGAEFEILLPSQPD